MQISGYPSRVCFHSVLYESSLDPVMFEARLVHLIAAQSADFIFFSLIFIGSGKYSKRSYAGQRQFRQRLSTGKLSGRTQWQMRHWMSRKRQLFNFALPDGSLNRRHQIHRWRDRQLAAETFQCRQSVRSDRNRFPAIDHRLRSLPVAERHQVALDSNFVRGTGSRGFVWNWSFRHSRYSSSTFNKITLIRLN